MNITVEYAGDGHTYEDMKSRCDSPNSAFHAVLRNYGLSAVLQFKTTPFQPGDLLCPLEEPRVLLIDGVGALTSRLGALENVKYIPPDPRWQSKVITLALFPAPLGVRQIPRLPKIISDYAFISDDYIEIAHRVAVSVRSAALQTLSLPAGQFTLDRESCQMYFQDKGIRLSRAEFSLAELFMAKFGSIIPVTQLFEFFQASGRSTEINNIRVTIHQLRLKLEELTHNQLQLVTVYRKGYCLRQARRPDQVCARQPVQVADGAAD